jgi:hypothetical protein
VHFAWRCFYFPPTPRDLTSGAEAIAEYTVREHTMINSVFAVNDETNNNPFKPPYIACLQIIYKLAGFPFGQIWLTTIFISFIVFLYHAVSITLHRLLAGILIIAFLAIPEMYAYTIMALFDYSNAVFFFLSAWFLFLFIESRQRSWFIFSSILMGIATYIRSETLVFACLITPFLLWQMIRSRQRLLKALWLIFIFLLPALLMYVLTISVYINAYLPVKYHVQDSINTHLSDLGPLVQRFLDMNSILIFSKTGITRYGYFFFLFLFILAADIVYCWRLNKHALAWLYFTGIIYLGLPLLGYLLPLMDLDNTTKRGLFKIFPLMLLYIANSRVVVKVSDEIIRWEIKNDK